MNINLTQSEIDFLKKVWRVDDPQPLIENLVRQHLNQLVNQEFKTADIETKLSIIEQSDQKTEEAKNGII